MGGLRREQQQRGKLSALSPAPAPDLLSECRSFSVPQTILPAICVSCETPFCPFAILMPLHHISSKITHAQTYMYLCVRVALFCHP